MMNSVLKECHHIDHSELANGFLFYIPGKMWMGARPNLSMIATLKGNSNAHFCSSTRSAPYSEFCTDSVGPVAHFAQTPI
jgi:hypothetical protein